MGWTGRLEYLWWPVASRYSQGNNPVRQWMATNALWDLYRYTGQDRYRAAARRNLAYNLRTFYRDVPGEDMGAIFYENTAKLGAAAFALTAVLHIDEEGRERPTLERLKKFILSMQENDGSFRSLYPPGGHDPEQSRVLQRYYAGEALLALVTLHEREPDPKLLDAVRKAFPYYREFVRTDAHPASVPWLTQAYVRAHRLEKNREYAEFVFRISDFVAGIQEAWTEAAPDEQGTFYDPERPEHGPPLSASTGVYVEGLVDAYRLAKDYNDAERQKRYRKAIVQGIRSLIQLQFRGDNLFFVKEPERTRGGIRASVTESSIRIDYTQHAAQAMIQAVQALDDWPGSLDRPAVGRP
jgi:hypothetical protein